MSRREYREVKKHPQLAFEWMSLLRDLDELVRIPYLHHERWDGSGYPLGLRGTEIPYRDAVSQAAILGYIARSSGTLFDPQGVDAFLRWRKKASGDSWAQQLVYRPSANLEKKNGLHCENKDDEQYCKADTYSCCPSNAYADCF